MRKSRADEGSLVWVFEGRQLGLECIFDLPRVSLGEAVLGAKVGVPRWRRRPMKQFP